MGRIIKKLIYTPTKYTQLLALLILDEDVEIYYDFMKPSKGIVGRIKNEVESWLIAFKLKRRYSEIYGSTHTLIGNKLLALCKKFVLIEDGTENYKKETKLTFKQKIIFRKSFFGRDKKIKKIYLTGIAQIPQDIAEKVEVINLKKLWDKKNEKQRKKILKIFSFEESVLKEIKGREIILFTQPLSEDNVILEEEKIELYKKIVEKYPEENLIIKKHPREKTDYNNYFDKVLVLNKPFPFELLNLLDIKFERAVTIFSTAALGLGKYVEVDFYGTEIHPKILSKFGSCKNIYPTTKIF